MRLGLIGDNIAASHAPRLHRSAGALVGLDVTYDSLVPVEEGLDFDALFTRCEARGYRGLNITHPYKVRAAERVRISDPLVRAMGAINTVLFEDDGPTGFNTDYTGFVEAIRRGLRSRPPGTVTLAGAGGVGKAMAFGLVALGARGIRIVDKDRPRAEALAEAVRLVAGETNASVADNVKDAAAGADGLLNATPIGMVGYSGNVFSSVHISGASWAFDAIYTPRETEFLRAARAGGLQVIDGYELFFYQGVDAWRLFHGNSPDEAALRAAIEGER